MKRPHHWYFILPCISVLTGSSRVVAAEGVDLQHFRPSANGLGLFGVESQDLLPVYQPFLGLSLNYAHEPLMVQFPDEAPLALSAYQQILHIQGGIGLQSWVDL